MTQELKDLIGIYLVAVIIAGAAYLGGYMLGSEREAEAQAAFMVETWATLDQAKARLDSLVAVMWVLDCNQRPVADITRLDESRRLVTLSCNPDVVVPE